MNEIIKPATNAITLANYNADDDFADMRPQDRINPRISLMQALSPDVNAGKAVQGEFCVNGQSVLKRGDKLKFIPLMWWFQWTEFNVDRNAPKDKKIIAKSVDANSELAILASKYAEVLDSKGNKVMRVTEAFNFAILIPAIGGWDTVYTTTFQRSAHKVGKTFLNRLKSLKSGPEYKTMPFFSHFFDLSAEFIDKGADKKYFAPVIGNQYDVPEDKLEYLLQLSVGLKAQKQAFIQRELDRTEEDATEVADVAAQDKEGKTHF